MRARFLPLQTLLLAFAGWTSRHQQEVIEYLREENRVLREQIGDRRLRLTDGQRRRLAAKGKRLGRAVLARVANIVTPDTILHWHRRLISVQWTFPGAGTGRPGVRKEIRRLIVQMATENSSWGYCRIQGALRNLGHRVSPSTVRNVLKEHGIQPAPDRPTTWRAFLRSHGSQVVATDFFTAEVWTVRGLRTYYVLFFLDLETRRVHFAGITLRPDDRFMADAVRSLRQFLEGKRFLLCDRDTKYSLRFAALLSEQVRLLRTPFQAPNAHAHAERFVRSIKSECPGLMIWIGEQSLRRAICEYFVHEHCECDQRGLRNKLIEARPAQAGGDVVRRERLGGLLKHYERAA